MFGALRTVNSVITVPLLTVIEKFSLTLWIKMRSLTKGNLKKENTVKEMKFHSYPLKLTATWDFILKTVGTNR